MSIGEVAAEIASAANDAGNVATQAGQVSLDLEEATADVARVTRGTNASEPGATMTAWEKAADHAQRAAQLLRAGNDALAGYLKAIGSGAGSPLVEPTKSGQDLLNRDDEGIERNFKGLADRLVRYGGDVKDLTGKVSKGVSEGLAYKRALDKPPGPTSTGTGVPEFRSAPDPQPSASDIATGIAIGVIVVTKGIQVSIDKITDQIREWKHGKR